MPSNTNTSERFFGPYGGRYVAEMLIPVLDEIEAAYDEAMADESFLAELQNLYHTYSGRPTPLTYAENLTKTLGGAKIYLKNEGLNHTGAHKINHCIGQGLLAKRMGKTRLIAETGAGQHGLATATVAAKLGMECTIYMGAVDIKRQRPNVFYMERLGATVVSVETGAKTLKDAVGAAMRDLLANSDDTYYVIGSVLGPAPYPRMNRDFQSIVGKEVREQLQQAEKSLPDVLVACVGGGSNSIGLFAPFLDEASVRMIGVEAGGVGDQPGQHAARFKDPKVGVLHGYKSYLLQDEDGQVIETTSIAAGLDYPAVGPQLAQLADIHRIEFTSATNQEALDAYAMLAKTEGILPALESAHAVAHAINLAPTMNHDEIIVVNVSGRGDKDIFTLAKGFKDSKFHDFLAREVSGNE